MKRPANPSLLEAGIYTVPDVAELVAAPKAWVRVWVGGHSGKQAPVIENQLGRVDGKVAVSFINLMELQFVATFAKAGVKLPAIRKIMNEVRHALNHPHPFATKTVFKTDGKKIVADIAMKNGVDNIYDLRSKNYEMRVVVMKSLKDDIVYDPFGDAAYWRPRPTLAPNVIVHPHFSFGQPVLVDSLVPARTLAQSAKAEGSAAAAAELYEVPLKHVREAIAFEKSLQRAA